MVKLIFVDDTEITAEQNVDCYIVDTKPEFPADMSTIAVEDEEGAVLKTLVNAELIECACVDDRYWFTFREIPAAERTARKMQADLEYIAMMTDVELEDENA